jgi:hypothetical protein
LRQPKAGQQSASLVSGIEASSSVPATKLGGGFFDPPDMRPEKIMQRSNVVAERKFIEYPGGSARITAACDNRAKCVRG